MSWTFIHAKMLSHVITETPVCLFVFWLLLLKTQNPSVAMLVPKKPLNWWKNDYEYMETKYVNCEWSREWKRVCTVVYTADHKSVENNMPNQYV